MARRATGRQGLRIAVVGAGPIGLAAAQGLARLPHVEVTVIERGHEGRQADAPDGRALEIWPNALTALHALDPALRDALAAPGFGVDLERYDFRASSGQMLWPVPTGALSRRLGSVTRVVTPRQLHAAVRSAVAPVAGKLALRFGADVARVVAGPDEVALQVGGVDEGYDLVLAADGAASGVRRRAVDAKGQPLFDPGGVRPARACAVVGWTPVERPHPYGGRGVGYVLHADDTRFGGWASPEAWADEPTAWRKGAKGTGAVRWLAFLPLAELVDDATRAAWFVGSRPLSTHRDGARKERFEVDLVAALRQGLDAPGARAALLDRVRTRLHLMPAPVKDLLDRAVPASVALHALWDRGPGAAWRSGRVALLGDAAHPVLPDLGQGCAMAFEDAEALVRHLGPVAPGGDVDAALDAWERERRGRVEEVVQLSHLASEAAHAEMGPGIRDLLTATIGPRTMLPNLYHLMSWRPPTDRGRVGARPQRP